MKKHLSIIMLMAGSTFYKLIFIFAAMAAAETALFYKTLKFAAGVSSNYISISCIEMIIHESRITWIFFLAVLLISLVLCRTGCEFKSRQGYTLKRLALSEKGVFLWQAVYSTLCYIILWGIQLILLLVFCKIYLDMPENASASHQTVFASFYRNKFMHNMLPLDDSIVYIRNIVLAFGLGFASAVFSYKQRRGGFGAQIIVLAAASLLFFNKEMGSLDYCGLLIIISSLTIIQILNYVLRKEEYDEA
ncbi:MAG: hypothetical protein Q4C14_04840 [Bacillota bacterium]|nr:hypothetical protein [Bacillota bacterium]